MRQLVERDEHERAAFSRCGRRFDKKVLLAALFVGALLHGPHAECIGFCRSTVAGIGNRNGGYGFLLVGHALAPALRFLVSPCAVVILV